MRKDVSRAASVIDRTLAFRDVGRVPGPAVSGILGRLAIKLDELQMLCETPTPLPQEDVIPIFDNIRTNELDPDTEQWFVSVLGVIETLDAAAHADYMAADVEIVMDASGARLQGREEVREGLARAWSGLRSLVHDEQNIYGSSHRFAHETVTHVVTKDGQQIDTRTCVWIDRDDQGQIRSARVY